MPIRLDKRLSLIASLAEGGSVADIGCDHGKLSYYLISTDRATKAIATDISAASLEKARELALANGVEDAMICRLGDGLDPIASGEVDAVIIAGLGGDLIARMILAGYAGGKRFESYILSPNTHPEKVRQALTDIGQRIDFDEVTECGGKLYTVMRSRAGRQDLDDIQLLFGAFYMDSEDFPARAAAELKYLEELISSGAEGNARARAEMLKKALYNIKNRG